jgi:hypothetical protein
MFPTIEEFLNIFFQDSEEKRWFLERIAYSLQFPEHRLPTCCILTGIQGSGKDMLRRILGKALHDNNVSNIDGKIITGTFNSYVGERQIVFANEVFNWEKKQEIENFLKNYVSNETIMMNQKHEPIRSIKNYATWVFATNDHQFRPFSDDDRRFSVFANRKTLIERWGNEKINRLSNMIDEDPAMLDEFHAFYWYLMTLKIKDVSWLKVPFDNKAKEQMQMANAEANYFFNEVVNALKKMNATLKIYEKDKHKLIKLFELYETYRSGNPPKPKNKATFKDYIIGKNWFEELDPVWLEGKTQRFMRLKSKTLIKSVFETPEGYEDEIQPTLAAPKNIPDYSEIITEQEKKRREEEAGETLGD